MIVFPSLKQIHEDMVANAKILISGNKPIPKLSLLNIFMVVFATAIHIIYGHLKLFLSNLLPDKAKGELLRRWAYVYQIAIDGGTAAEGRVIFTGTAGAVIPEDTKLQRSDGTIYRTIGEAVIEEDGESSSTLVRAEKVGRDGNTLETLLTLVTSVADVDNEAAVSSAIEGGAEEDSDEQVRYKLLNRIRMINMVGTVPDYIYRTLNVSGVGRVWVDTANEYLGPNTVRITVATVDNEPVSETVLSEVKATLTHPDSILPGVILAIDNVVNDPIDFTITAFNKTTDLESNMRDSLDTIFRKKAQPHTVLPISYIWSAVAATGAVGPHIEAISRGGVELSIEDIAPAEGKKLSLGTVTVLERVA